MDAATLAPYVAAGAALVVGLGGPWWTNRVVTQRQREQLSHDRAMRQREETIALLEKAAKTGGKRLSVADHILRLWQEGIDPNEPSAQDAEHEWRVAFAQGAW